MAVGVAAPEVGDPAAPALDGGAGVEAPLVAAGKEEPPPPDGVTATAIEVVGEGPAALVSGAGEVAEAPFMADEKEAPPADGVPVVEVEEKGAAAPLDGAPAAITVEGEEEAQKAEDKEEEEEEEEAAAPLEGEPAVITVEGEEEARKAVEAEKAAAAEEEEADEGEKWLGQYSSGQSILIVGDGDFSFSLALATAFGSGANLVATSLDTYEALKRKYSKAESNIMELKRLGASVLHGVDAKKMRFHTDLKNSRFDRIIFNFPHAGFKGKEDDMHMINLHKELLWGFFFNARHLVRRYGEIHVTHKTGQPYDKWDLEHLAFCSSLALVEKVTFRKEDYPGYNQKRGDRARCDEPFDLGACCTFKFQIGDLKKLKKMNGMSAGSIPSLGGNNIRPGHWVTDRGPFHPLPPFEAWSWQHFPPPDNTGSMLIPLPSHIADQRPQPGFPPNSDGIVRAPYFHQQDGFHPVVGMPGPWLNALPLPGCVHQQDSFHPVLKMPGPWLNALPPPGGIPPPMGRIPWPDLFAPHEQPWYQQGTVPDQLGGRDNYFVTGNALPAPPPGGMPPPMGRIPRLDLLAPHEQPWYQQVGGRDNYFVTGNALPAPPPGGIPPPMGRIPRLDLVAPHEQPWYQQGTVSDQLGGDNYFVAVNALPDPPSGGVPPPTGRIPCPDLLAPQEQHWYQQGTVPDHPGGNGNFLAGEYERSRQREDETQRQVMPGPTGFNHSAFLDHLRDKESVQKQEWLRRIITFYGM